MSDNAPRSSATAVWLAVAAPRRVAAVAIRGRMARGVVVAILLAFCAVSVALLAQRLPRLFFLDDGGYPDSYVMYDVLQLQKTGVVYRDLSQPPYLPSLYSPLVYIAYSLPGRFVNFENPFSGPRLLALAAFLFCVGIVGSVVRTLVLVRFAWIWGVLFVCTIRGVWDWLLLIRADFLGVACGLLAIRLLLSRSGHSVLLAGIASGLATQFKITYVAALAAGALWLLLRRQWNELARFLAAGALTSAGLYLVFLFREPNMLSQLVTLGQGVTDLRGCVKLIYQAISEPVTLFALLGLPPFAWQVRSRWSLLVLFVATSFAIAAVTGLQAGGGINYFFETLFAIVPFAVLGILRFMALAARRMMIGAFIAALVVSYIVVPRAQELRQQLQLGSPSVESRNEAFRQLEAVLRGHRIFASVPRLALLDPTPALMEPFLFGVMQRAGQFDGHPLLARIHSGEFDVVITHSPNLQWRNLVEIGPELRDAIAAGYVPYCRRGGLLFHLPRMSRPSSGALAQELTNIKCVRVPPGPDTPALR